jgi:hypothetical protein
MEGSLDFQAIASFTDKALRGRQLSSVEFVQDYLQLRFDGPCLTLLTWPRVIDDRKVFGFNDPGYRDALCALIGQLIAQVSFSQDHSKLIIAFENESGLEISLHENDPSILEAVKFDNTDGEWWVI